MRKSRLMKDIEQKTGQKLEKLLTEEVTANGLTHTAETLGVSKATLSYWLLKFNIRVQRIALGPNDYIRVVRGEE